MSNIFDQFDSQGTSSTGSVNIFDQFDGNAAPQTATNTANPALAAQWAAAGPAARFKMIMQGFGPRVATVDGPILKSAGAGIINTGMTAAGAVAGSPVGPAGSMAGAAGGNALGQQISTELGLQPKVQWGQVAGAGIMPAGSGPITAPLAAVAGTEAQSLIDNKELASLPQVALSAIGGRAAAGEPLGPVGSQVTKDATLAEGTQAGYVLPPNETNPNILNRVGASLAGKADLKTAAIARNQETTNTLAATALGLDPSQPITEQAINGVKAKANQVYAQVGSLSPEAADTLEQLKQARFDAKANYNFYNRSADPKVLAQAKASAADAEAAEQLLEQEAVKNGQPGLVTQLQAARTTLAKANVVDQATNYATGNVSAPAIGKLFDQSKPLTGELGTIGKFNQAFPLYTGEAEKRAGEGVSKLGLGEAAALGAYGVEKFGPAGAALGALPFTDKIARGTLLSGPYQSMMAQPSYGYAPAGMAQNLARFAPQQINALQPNIALLTQNTQ